MRLHDFSFTIPEGRETEEGYVYLHHGTKYTIRLDNAGDRRCDAKVSIDGKSVGTFRVKSDNSILIERPPKEDGCFTFYKSGSPEAESSQLGDDDALGLISVEFRPERISSGIDSETKLYQSALRTPSEAGGTGLSGESKQEFNSIKALSTDPAEHVTIHLRLICEPNDARPLHKRETQIPPAMNRAAGNPLHAESAASASSAYANKRSNTETLPEQDARKGIERPPIRAELPTPVRPAAPAKPLKQDRSLLAEKSTKHRSIRCDCKKCGISGEVEVANHRTSVICPQCAGFAYRQIGMNRLNFSVGIAVTVAVFVIITFLGGEVPPGFILAIPLIALSSFRCANIGCSFLWALIPVIPWLSIFLTFPSQSPNPSKLKRGQECSNFTVSSGVPATRSFSASTWMAFILWLINRHRIKFAVASLIIVSVIVYWVVSDGDDDRNSSPHNYRSSTTSPSSENNRDKELNSYHIKKLTGLIVLGLNEITQNRFDYDNEISASGIETLLNAEQVSADAGFVKSRKTLASVKQIIQQYRSKHNSLIMNLPTAVENASVNQAAKDLFHNSIEDRIIHRNELFNKFWDNEYEMTIITEQIFNQLATTRDYWEISEGTMNFFRKTDLDNINRCFDQLGELVSKQDALRTSMTAAMDDCVEPLKDLPTD